MYTCNVQCMSEGVVVINSGYRIVLGDWTKAVCVMLTESNWIKNYDLVPSCGVPLPH